MIKLMTTLLVLISAISHVNASTSISERSRRLKGGLYENEATPNMKVYKHFLPAENYYRVARKSNSYNDCMNRCQKSGPFSIGKKINKQCTNTCKAQFGVK